jgi:hypothetical protein
MTLIEHLHALIESGKFEEYSSDAKFFYLYFLAGSQGKPTEILIEEVVQTTGLSEDLIHQAIRDLVETGLVVQTSSEPLCIEPGNQLKWDEMNLPLPQNRKQWSLGFQESIENFVCGQWSGLLAGSLMVYFIHFWFKHIHEMDEIDSAQACETLSRDSIFEGFQELEVLAYKHLEKPLHQIHPLEWVVVLERGQADQSPSPSRAKISMEEVESMFEVLDSSTED